MTLLKFIQLLFHSFWPRYVGVSAVSAVCVCVCINSFVSGHHRLDRSMCCRLRDCWLCVALLGHHTLHLFRHKCHTEWYRLVCAFLHFSEWMSVCLACVSACKDFHLECVSFRSHRSFSPFPVRCVGWGCVSAHVRLSYSTSLSVYIRRTMINEVRCERSGLWLSFPLVWQFEKRRVAGLTEGHCGKCFWPIMIRSNATLVSYSRKKSM